MNTEAQTEQSDDERQWLTTTQAGAALGISPRSVQKRCAAGTLAARRVPIPGGFKWEVEAREIEAGTPELKPGTPEPERPDPRNLEAGTGESRAHKPRNLGPTLGTKIPEPDPGTPELKSERETEMRAEITFLRNIVEAQQRDAVELRQALKRALDLAPKQLTAGTTGAEPIEAKEETGAAAVSKAEAASVSPPPPQGKKSLNIAQIIKRSIGLR